MYKEAQQVLTEETRVGFREASSELVTAARSFQKTQARAATVARNGATYASTNLELSGIPPSTYRAPYARRGEAKGWA